jgi:hypothetical protein
MAPRSAQVNHGRGRPGVPAGFWRGVLVALPLAGVLWGGLGLLVRAILGH